MNKDTEVKENGAICGGVISETLFYTDPMAYMMCWTMTDGELEQYKNITDKKQKSKFFDTHAISHI